MVALRDILERGYFPKELPPPFTTTSLASRVNALGAPKAGDSNCARYTFSKYASVRRTLSIPNPAHFVRLAKVVADNWLHLSTHCARSQLSKTCPTPDRTRAITWATPLDQLPLCRATARVGARYALLADVSSFYGSLYTHSIPWALHTKATAKKDRGTKKNLSGGPPLYGNLLDQAFRNIQSGQTVGIPIGPDTSLPIGESILAEVDRIVSRHMSPTMSGFRFVDDYELCCDTYTEAEGLRATLQDALGEFELALNPRKTRIIELPEPLDTPWAQNLAAFVLDGKTDSVLHSQLLRYFSRAFELAKDFPGEPILKFAVRRLSEVDIVSAGTLVQKLLFQAAAADAGTLQTALYVTFLQRSKGVAVEPEALRRAIAEVICRHAPLQHGGDVAWALWGAIVFGVQLEDRVLKALESHTDSVGILVALLAETKGLCARPLDRTRWLPLVDAAELFDSRWLLAYEAPGRGWIPATGGVDPALSDPFFEKARKQGVTFIDPNTALTIPEPSPAHVYA